MIQSRSQDIPVHVARVWAVVAAVIFIGGAAVRFTGLGVVPGLEHDEALICLGARNILSDPGWTLTGDKVYEGPLLEYLLSGPVWLSGGTVWSCRAVMAVAGSLSVLFLGVTAGRIAGFPAGVTTLALAAFNPWSLASSRVIYACNLSPCLAAAYLLCLVQFHRSGRFIWMGLAGLGLGLTMHGRITAGILLIPALYLLLFRTRAGRARGLVLLLLPAAVVMSPVIGYNLIHGWPAMDVLVDNSQKHFILTEGSPGATYAARLAGLTRTLAAGLDGTGVWLDFPPPNPIWPGWISFLLLIGAGAALFSSTLRRNPLVHCVWMAFLLPLIVHPLVMKHIHAADGSILYHPHYLDLLIPSAFILSGFAASWLTPPRWSRTASGLSVMVVLLGVTGVQWRTAARIYTSCLPSGGPGRWHRGYEMAADRIRTLWTPDEVRIAMNWTFGAGYPQMSFLLPGYRVVPYLLAIPGCCHPDGTSIPCRTVTAGSPELQTGPDWVEHARIDLPGINPISILSRRSPDIRIDAVCTGGDPLGTGLRIGDRGPAGTWAGSLIRSDGRAAGFTVTSRRDIFCRLENILRLKDQVTPRHRAEIEMIGRYPCRYELSGVTGDLEPVGMVWTLSESGWTATISIGSYWYSGPVSGTVIFH